MAISIHIDDVTSEDGQALFDLAKYLIDASGLAPVQDERPIAEKFSEFMAQAASGTGVPFAFAGTGAPSSAIEGGSLAFNDTAVTSHGSLELDADAGKLTAIFGAGAAGPTLADIAPSVHPGVASLIPPPPPAASADYDTSSVSPSPIAVTPPTGVTVDSSGYPWDSRIHSAKKTIIGNGTWKYRRNCDEALIKQVEYELRQTMGLPPPEVAAMMAAASTGPGTIAAYSGTPPTEPGAAIIPPPPPAAEVPPPVNPLPAFMEWAVGQSTAGKIPQAQILSFVQAQGLPHIGALFTRPDLVPVVRAEIEKYIVANGGTL